VSSDGLVRERCQGIGPTRNSCVRTSRCGRPPTAKDADGEWGPAAPYDGQVKSAISPSAVKAIQKTCVAFPYSSALSSLWPLVREQIFEKNHMGIPPVNPDFSPHAADSG